MLNRGIEVCSSLENSELLIDRASAFEKCAPGSEFLERARHYMDLRAIQADPRQERSSGVARCQTVIRQAIFDTGIP